MRYPKPNSKGSDDYVGVKKHEKNGETDYVLLFTHRTNEKDISRLKLILYLVDELKLARLDEYDPKMMYFYHSNIKDEEDAGRLYVLIKLLLESTIPKMEGKNGTQEILKEYEGMGKEKLKQELNKLLSKIASDQAMTQKTKDVKAKEEPPSPSSQGTVPFDSDENNSVDSVTILSSSGNDDEEEHSESSEDDFDVILNNLKKDIIEEQYLEQNLDLELELGHKKEAELLKEIEKEYNPLLEFKRSRSESDLGSYKQTTQKNPNTKNSEGKKRKKSETEDNHGQKKVKKQQGKPRSKKT